MTSKERHLARYLRRKEKRDKVKNERNEKYGKFENVFTFDNMWKSQNKCYCGVGWKPSVQKYRNRPITNLSITYSKLYAEKYKSKGFYTFNIIERGKKRTIKSVHISERVVQKCLCDYSLVPMLTPTMIYDNGACLKGKGIDFTKTRLLCHLHRYYRKYGNDGYALLIDFSKYFDTINHDKLKSVINKEYKDERLIKLYNYFVDVCGDIGLGLGSQISQISAIKFPTEIDMLIKATEKFYARYCDDSYILSKDKNKLFIIKDKLQNVCYNYGIKLNERKTQIIRINKGLPFLKQRFILTTSGKVIKIPQKDSEKRMRSKLKVFSSWLIKGKVKIETVLISFTTWKSHFIKSNAFLRLQTMIKMYNKTIKGVANYG